MDSSRRKFIAQSGAAAIAITAGIASCGSSGEKTDTSSFAGNKSRVAVCRKQELFQLGRVPAPESVKDLLEKSLELFSGKSASEYFRENFKSGEKISLKVNCLSGKSMSTHTGLTYAVADLLISAGIRPEDITIWDRSDRDLQNAGYQLNRGKGVQVIGVDRSGYMRELIAHNSIGSFFANVLHESDKIINLPVLKDHGIVGVTLGMKNFFGGIHNPHKYHLNAGDPYVADLYSHPLIKDKVALTIIDGITGQYEGGPPPMPQWQWNFGGLVIGSDPAAVDRVGLDIIEAQRAEQGITPLADTGRFPHYLKTAAKLGLGNYDLEDIEVMQ